MTWRFLSRGGFIAAGVLLALLCGCHGGGGGTPPPSFTLTVSPSGLSIPAGGGGFATVTVARSGGFAEAVALSLDGAPAGVLGSGTIAASAPTGQLSLIVASGVAPQSLEGVRVKGTAGSLAQATPFKLVVSTALPPGEISADLVQASSGTQRAGVMENTGLALEPVAAVTSRSPTGTLEVRHGFKPSTGRN